MRRGGGSDRGLKKKTGIHVCGAAAGRNLPLENTGGGGRCKLLNRRENKRKKAFRTGGYGNAVQSPGNAAAIPTKKKAQRRDPFFAPTSMGEGEGPNSTPDFTQGGTFPDRGRLMRFRRNQKKKKSRWGGKPVACPASPSKNFRNGNLGFRKIWNGLQFKNVGNHWGGEKKDL